MPQVKTRLIELPEERSTQEVVKALQQALKRYATKYGSMYIGLAADPKKNFARHNKAITLGTGSTEIDDPWPLCVVLFETGAEDKTRKIRKKIVKWVMDQQGVNESLWNERTGGPGRLPKEGSTAYVYVLLDPKKTKWAAV